MESRLSGGKGSLKWHRMLIFEPMLYLGLKPESVMDPTLMIDSGLRISMYDEDESHKTVTCSYR